jgi:hypothetical protein
MMEIVVIWLFVWFVGFPKSFGKHLKVIVDSMRERDPK